MTGLTRWDPLKEVEDWQNRLSGLFGRAPVRQKNGEQESITVAEWAPLVDITEDDKEYFIKAELPEVKKDDMKVAVENGVLTIRGERKSEKEEKKQEVSTPTVSLTGSSSAWTWRAWTNASSQYAPSRVPNLLARVQKRYVTQAEK